MTGAQKLAKIRENSNFFRSGLQKMGFEVLGDNDSPVMPIMLYNPAKLPAFSRECLKRNVRLFIFSALLSHTFSKCMFSLVPFSQNIPGHSFLCICFLIGHISSTIFSKYPKFAYEFA